MEEGIPAHLYVIIHFHADEIATSAQHFRSIVLAVILENTAFITPEYLALAYLQIPEDLSLTSGAFYG
jgi:hypothetical protein